MPHASTLRSYVGSVDCEPGFLLKVLDAAALFDEPHRQCNLVLDEMKIKKASIFDKNRLKTYGNVDYGDLLTLECSSKIATNALVFMIVSLTGKFKWPIAWFLTNSVNATSLTELIKTAISLCHERNIKIWSLTCDGPKVNIATLNKLGCKIYENSYESIKHFFLHPITQEKVYATPDACHMLKNARNSFESIVILKHNENYIKWDYIKKLYEVQETINFKFANKISSRHLKFRANIMKVKLAAQTLSSSVADALEYLCENKIPGFEEAEETIKFIRTVDLIFDFLNSRNLFEKGYKQPISIYNIEVKEKFIISQINYLFELTADKVPIYLHPKRTFLLGFATAIKSVLDVAKNIFVQMPFYKFVLTYHFSQDFLELFFGAIRMRFGSNNNPNVLEFKYAIRRLLVKNYIQAGSNGNCVNFNENIGSIYSLNRKNYRVLIDSSIPVNNNIPEEKILEDDVNILLKLNQQRNVGLINNILGYIGGFIVRKLVPKLHCSSCIDAVVKEYRENTETNSDFEKLITFKNRGGLVFPKESVCKIIKTTENLIILLTNNFENFNNIDFNSIILKNKIHFSSENVFPETENCSFHLIDVPHKIQLIETITRKYLNTRLFTQSLKKTNDLSKGKEGTRQFHNKLVLLSSL